MKKIGKPVTPKELSSETNLSERYILEWFVFFLFYFLMYLFPPLSHLLFFFFLIRLSAAATHGYVSYDPSTKSFSLPEGHATGLLDESSPNYVAPFISWLPSLFGVLPDLEEAFKTGGGVDFEKYGKEAIMAIGEGNRPMYVHELEKEWMPKLGDLHDRLKKGEKYTK